MLSSSSISRSEIDDNSLYSNTTDKTRTIVKIERISKRLRRFGDFVTIVSIGIGLRERKEDIIEGWKRDDFTVVFILRVYSLFDSETEDSIRTELISLLIS